MIYVLRLVQRAALVALCALPLTAQSQDVRSLGMGGAIVSSGEGVGGFRANPALLMHAHRERKRFHFRFGGAVDARDNIDVVELVDENDNLADDLSDEIDQVADQTPTCVPGLSPAGTVCISGTSGLGSLASQTLSVFDTVSGETVEGRVTGDLGFAVSHTDWPFSVSLITRVTAGGCATISENDRGYAQTLIDTLSDNDITVDEIDVDNVDIDNPINFENGAINIDPLEQLTSEGTVQVLQRTQVAVSLARSFLIAGRAIDIGVSPKFSNHTASSSTTRIERLDDDDFDIQDELEANEATDSSFTLDLGASTGLMHDDLWVSGVIRNLVPESVESANGFEFETTPQLIASAQYDPAGFYRVTADLALNKAELDGFETQRLNLGTELTAGRWFDIRAGLQHDLAADDNPTTLTLGLGLGFIDLAAGFNDTNYFGGLQIAFSL